jgi:hypothetical protein
MNIRSGEQIFLHLHLEIKGPAGKPDLFTVCLPLAPCVDNVYTITYR